ncbi:hypothetical protein CF319_g8716 [Tilletia indica]|nr:hypothetical protein CF319_g8716 [Tilletia indica]
MRDLISNTQVGRYSITVTIAGRTVHAVYMPPSLNDDPSKLHSFKGYLRPADRMVPDVLIGDINVRFGKSFGDKESGPQSRLRVMNDFMDAHSLTHLRPLPSSPTRVSLDHTFVRPGVTATMIAHNPDFSTVHPILDVTASWPHRADPDVYMSTEPLESLLQPKTRIQLKNLDNPKHMRSLFWHWNKVYPKVLAALKKGRGRLDPRSAQGTVNKADSLIGRALWDVAAKALGRYNVDDMKRKPDYLAQGLQSKPTAKSAMRQYRRSQRGSQSVLVSRTPETTTVADDVKTFYIDLYSTKTIEGSKMPFRPPPSSQDDDLLRAFHHDAVDKAIREYSSSRSSGPDAIHHVLIKALANAGLTHWLSHLFELCALSGMTPTRWNTSIIHPIPKGASTIQRDEEAGVLHNDVRTIAEMRPISLTVMFRRLFEKCFLASFTPAEMAFHPGQAGFRTGYSTISQALVSHSDATQKGGYQAFVDLKQAYDRTVMLKLFSKLERRGFSPSKMALFYSLNVGTRSYVNINGALTLNAIPRTRGLFQGSLLAPFLFNVYIDDVPDSIRVDSTPESGTDTLLYADDIKIRADTRDKLQVMLTKLQYWCELNSMEINVKKSAELVKAASEDDWLEDSWMDSPPQPLAVYRQALPRVEEYTYLGFPHRVEGVDFQARCKSNFERANAMIRYLAVLGRQWAPAVRLAMYKTLARPLLDYGGAMLWHTVLAPTNPTSPESDSSRWKLSRLEKKARKNDRKEWKVIMKDHHREATEWISTRSKGPPDILGSIMGINRPEDRVYKLAIMLREHMNKLDPTSLARARIVDVSVLPREGTTYSMALIARTCSKEVLYQLPAEAVTRKTLDIKWPKPLALHDRVRAFLLVKLQEPKFPMLNYILPSARVPIPPSRATMTEPRPDALLYIDDREVCQRAIEWRINKLCIMSKCYACKGRFKRACVDRCAEGYGNPMTPEDARLLDKDLMRHDHLQEGKYLRPDAYLNHRRYKKFRKLVVHVDRLNRGTGTADEVKKKGQRDLSRKERAKKLADERHAADDVDRSTEPVWLEPESERPVPAPRDTIIPAAELPIDVQSVTTVLVPEAQDPPGCLTRTRIVGGETLPLRNTLEQYATLHPRLFRGYLQKPEDRHEFESRLLGIPRYGVRAAMLLELHRRAQGQGHVLHAPQCGQGYDPSKPYE